VPGGRVFERARKMAQKARNETGLNQGVKKLRSISDEIKELNIDSTTRILENNRGIKPGTYSISEIASMIYFLADMLER